MDIERLLQIADQLLSGKLSPEDELERIEEYVAGLQEWVDSVEQSGGDCGAQLDSTVTQLRSVHERLLTQVSLLKDQAECQLSAFRKKAKGVMSYADQLPSRISVAAERKG